MTRCFSFDIKKILGLGLSVLCLTQALTLTGCSTTKRYKVVKPKDSGEHHVAVVEDRIRFYGKNLSSTQEKALLANNIVYFDYDKYELHDDDLLAIYAHAKYLLDHPDMKVRIDGHTDERGSPAYNIALGERRAKAVQNILLFKNVPETQIELNSYGKEKLAGLDHSEESHRLNRRAELYFFTPDTIEQPVDPADWS